MTESNFIGNGWYGICAHASNDPNTVIEATNNWWGTTQDILIQSMIFDHDDSLYCPRVNYTPYATAAFDINDSLPVDVDEADDPITSAAFELGPNYPNPFNNQTVIEYSLPRRTDISFVVYNILGQMVNSSYLEKQPAGTHTILFDAVDRNNNSLPSGVYFYRISTGDTKQTRKMILLK